MAHPLLTTEDLIRTAVHKFAAPRGQRYVYAGGRGVHVHTPGEKILHLPNGTTVRVWTDDSGRATQIEEDEAMHAVARPGTIRFRLRPDMMEVL